MEPTFPATRHSITFRMTLTVCAFLILFQVLLAAVIFFYFKREFKQTISNQQFTLLTSLAQNIDQKLLSSQKVIVDVSRTLTPEIISDSEAAQKYLDSRPGTHSLFDNGLFLISADGRIIAESPYLPNRRGRDISFRDFYKKTISSGLPAISEPYLSTHTPGAPAIMFTAPVLDKGGKLLAILGGSLNLLSNNFLGELSRTRIAENGYLYIIARDRTLIMHPDQSRIMTRPVTIGANKLLEEAFQGFEGSGENVNSRGLRSLTSFKRFKNTDWIMGANYPLAEAYAPIYLFQRYLFAAIVIGTLLSVLVVRLITGRFTSTLVRFADHVKNISTKQDEDRLFINVSNDEIGILARTFNTMIQNEDQKSDLLTYTSTHDSLSGLFNRTYFDSETARLSRGRVKPISVVMADIDNLKLCNDTIGHAAGDALIKATAQVLIESFRAEDIVARIGGDEFAILLPGVDTEQVATAVERVMEAVAKLPKTDNDFNFSISLGQATSETPEGLEDAIKKADQEMYKNKTAHKQTPA